MCGQIIISYNQVEGTKFYFGTIHQKWWNEEYMNKKKKDMMIELFTQVNLFMEMVTGI